MRSRKNPIGLVLSGVLVCGAILSGWVTTVPAGNLASFTEAFTSAQYQDTAGTTAWWDTTLGEVKRFPFAGSEIGGLGGIYASDVVVRGNLAYTAAGANGIQVIDISNPTAPVVVGAAATPTNAFLDVAGDVALVTCGNNGLVAVDVTDPTNPATIDTLLLGTSAAEVKIRGSLAYTVGNDDFLVINISKPDSMFLAGSTLIPAAFGQDVVVAGNYAYVAAGNGFAIVDITDPTAPSLVVHNSTGTMAGVAVDGDHLFLADVDLPGLHVYDVSNPASPVALSTPLVVSDIAISLDLSGDWVYMATRSAGVTVINVKDPSNPFIHEEVDTPGIAEAIAVSGDLTFVADLSQGLRIQRNGNNAWPVISQPTPTMGTARRVCVQGNLAYLAEGADGMTILDVTDENNPLFVSNFPLVDATDIAVEGDVAYVANGSGGLKIIDVTDPYNPALISTPLSGTFIDVFDVWVDGPVLHALYNDITTSTWYIMDVSNPGTPLSLGGKSGFFDRPRDVATEGGLAVVATDTGVDIYDISSLPTLTLLDSGPSLNLLEVAMDGNLAYCAGYDSTLYVYDLTDPTSITLLGSGNLYFPGFPAGTATELIVSGDWVYVTADTIGIYLVNVEDPTNPFFNVAYLNRTTGICAEGELLHLAHGPNGYGSMVHSSREFAGPGSISARSLTVPSGPDTVRAIRGSATIDGKVEWFRVTALPDSGYDWSTLGEWELLTDPGTEVRWNLSMGRPEPRRGSVLSDLTLEYLYDASVITEVTDIPNDQGRQVRLTWTRSVHDDPGATAPVIEYAVYRQIDPGLAAPGMLLPAAVNPARPDLLLPGDPTPGSGDLEGGHRGNNLTPLLAGWDYLGTVPADVDDAYSMVVPTLVDSTLDNGVTYSAFLVRGRTATPGVYFESHPDSGYSVDNLAPNAPLGMAAAYGTGSGNMLSWEPSADADFRYFAVYRGVTPDFPISSGNQVTTTTGITWMDPSFDDGSVFYKATAVDFAGNESTPSSPGTVTGVQGELLPKVLTVFPNAPNPFRSSTTIRYQLPRGGGDVSLRIFDPAGRLVRTLISGYRSEGSHEAAWNGRDDGGRRVGVGQFYYRLRVGPEVRQGSMIRLR